MGSNILLAADPVLTVPGQISTQFAAAIKRRPTAELLVRLRSQQMLIALSRHPLGAY